MTAPDPLALAEEAERAICSRVVGKDRDYGPLTNREYQDILALAAALRAAHEENKRLVTQAAELGKWRDAVLNAAVVDWTYRKEHETDPVRAVNDLVCYALDVEREALRKENRTMRVALEGLKAEMPRICSCSEDYTDRDMIDPACDYHDYGGWALRVIDAALAGGKGEK